jgi:hypothetical protein
MQNFYIASNFDVVFIFYLNQFYCNQVKLKDKTDEKKFVGILLETIFTTNSKKKKASESDKNKILYTFQKKNTIVIKIV